MNKISIIDLSREDMKFSSGHFTIFSATEREHLHGHNYRVEVALTVVVEEQGLNFDYRYYKNKMYELCQSLDHSFLLPMYSPFLSFEEDENYLYAIFNRERLPFLRKDIILLPISNITVEELSHWFLKQLQEAHQELKTHHIEGIVVKVYSTPGICGIAKWEQAEY